MVLFSPTDKPSKHTHHMRTTRLLGIDLAYSLSLLGTIAFGLFFLIGDRLIYLSHEHYFPFLDVFPALFLFMNGLTTTLTLRDRRISSRKLFSFSGKKGSLLLLIGLVFCAIWPINIFFCCGICYMLAPSVVRYSTPILAVLAVLIGLFSIAALNYGVPAYVTFFGIELSGSGFRELIGFLFYNGYFSILPWTVFFIAGLIVGRSQLQTKSLLGPSNMIGFVLIVIGYLIQKFTANYYINRDIIGIEGNLFLLKMKLYLPAFIFYGTGVSMVLTNLCIYIMSKLENKRLTNFINAISGAKYSIYSAHLAIGLITLGIFNTESFGNKFVLLTYILFNIGLSIWLILQWKKKVTDLGPIEWIMKRLSSSVRN